MPQYVKNDPTYRLTGITHHYGLLWMSLCDITTLQNHSTLYSEQNDIVANTGNVSR